MNAVARCWCGHVFLATAGMDTDVRLKEDTLLQNETGVAFPPVKVKKVYQYFLFINNPHHPHPKMQPLHSHTLAGAKVTITSVQSCWQPRDPSPYSAVITLHTVTHRSPHMSWA